jgi:hypothetical protein
MVCHKSQNDEVGGIMPSVDEMWDAPPAKGATKKALPSFEEMWDSAPAKAKVKPQTSKLQQFGRGLRSGLESVNLGIAQGANALTGGHLFNSKILNEMEAERRAESEQNKASRGGEAGFTNLGSIGEFTGESLPSLAIPGGAFGELATKAKAGENALMRGSRAALNYATKAKAGENVLMRGSRAALNYAAKPALTGAAMGFAQPTVEGESRFSNALMGGALGGAVTPVGKVLGDTKAGQAVLSPWKTVKRMLPKYAVGINVANAKAAATIKDIAESETMRAKGIPVTIAEETKDPGLLQMQRVLSKEEGEPYDMARETLGRQSEAVQGAVQGLKGEGTRAGLVKTVQTLAEQIAKDLESAQQGSERELELLHGEGAYAPNSRLAQKAFDAHKELKGQVDSRYSAMGDTSKISVPVPGLSEVMRNIENIAGSDFTKAMPRLQRVMSRVGEAVAGNEEISLEDFKALRENIGELSAATKGSQQGHFFNEVFKQLQSYEDAVIKANPDAPGIKEWKVARDFYRNVYVPTFKQGIGEDLIGTARNGEPVTETSKIMSKFVPKGYKGVDAAAQDFAKIYGTDASAKADLLDAVRADAHFAAHGDKGKMLLWMRDHGPALKAYGFENEFKTVTQAIKSAEQAGKAATDFAASALAKVLDKEPHELGKFLMGNPQALREAAISNPAGAKAAIGDELESRLDVGGWRTLDDVVKSAKESIKFQKEVLPILKDSGLYSEADIDSFNAVHDSVQRLGQMGTTLPKMEKKNKGVWEAVARVAGYAASKITGRVGAYPIGKESAKWYDMGYHNKAKEYMRHALHDPVYAKELAKYAIELDTAIKEDWKPALIKNLITNKKAKLGAWNLYNSGQYRPVPEGTEAPEPEGDQ